MLFTLRHYRLESIKQTIRLEIAGKVFKDVNRLIHAVKLADASSKSVVTPNVDTYYTRLWMDLSQEPLVLDFPDVKDRFCNIQVLDA